MSMSLLVENPVFTGARIYIHAMRHKHTYVTCLKVSCNETEYFFFLATDQNCNEDIKGFGLSVSILSFMLLSKISYRSQIV